MKKIAIGVLTFLSISIFIPQFTNAQDKAQLKKERIQASYLLSYGRLPSTAELNWWMGSNDYTVSELIGAHRVYMNKTWPAIKDDAIKKSYLLAFGREDRTQKVTDGEVKHWKGRSEMFWEMLPLHVLFAEQNKAVPGIYDNVIINAYNMLFKKAPNATELSRWKTQPAKSFAELIFLLAKTPPAGYTVDYMVVLNAMEKYKDFTNVKFSPAVESEIIAITNSSDLYNKFKNGIR